MKKILILILFGTTILNCSKDDDNGNSNSCDFDILISSEQYKSAPSAPLTINNLEINNNCLKINFSSGGCNGNTWEIKLIDSEAILESNPAQRNLKLSLNNKEACFAIVTKELTFDISNLQIDGNKVLLNITNSDENILYEY